MHSPERSLVAGVQEEQEISNLSQSTSDCPGLDTHRGNDELCQKGEIMCWPTMWPLQDLYCHKVGLDIAAEEATPAFSDQITPTRKLEEEIEILNPQELASESCGCPVMIVISQIVMMNVQTVKLGVGVRFLGMIDFIVMFVELLVKRVKPKFK